MQLFLMIQAGQQSFDIKLAIKSDMNLNLVLLGGIWRSNGTVKLNAAKFFKFTSFEQTMNKLCFGACFWALKKL